MDVLASLLHPYNGRDIVESVFRTELIRRGEYSTGKISEQYNVSEEKCSVAFYAVTIIRYWSVHFFFDNRINDKRTVRYT